MSYTPKPGTNAYRAIRMIEAYSAEWVPGSLLASVIGLDPANVVPFLLTPVKHGYLRKRIVHVGPKRTKRTEWAVGHVRLVVAAQRPVQPAPRTKPNGPASIWDYAARRAA